jgi:hypothetical protein
MNVKNARFILIGCFVSAALACITVNIYFPEATVKKAAEEIVNEVRKDSDKDKENKEKKGASRSFLEQRTFSFIPAAYAQEETTVASPRIRALKQSLRERFPQLRPFFENGNIGESNDGWIQVRDEASLGLKDKAILRGLVREENRDREMLYTAVAKALNVASSQVPRIGKIFAENWIRNARPGWWIQKDDGEWIRKSNENSV